MKPTKRKLYFRRGERCQWDRGKFVWTGLVFLFGTEKQRRRNYPLQNFCFRSFSRLTGYKSKIGEEFEMEISLVKRDD